MLMNMIKKEKKSEKSPRLESIVIDVPSQICEGYMTFLFNC